MVLDCDKCKKTYIVILCGKKNCPVKLCVDCMVKHYRICRRTTKYTFPIK